MCDVWEEEGRDCFLGEVGTEDRSLGETGNVVRRMQVNRGMLKMKTPTH